MWGRAAAVCGMRDLCASGSCASCWGRTSHVALGEYIRLLQEARAAGAAWQALFPATVELEMSESIVVGARVVAHLDPVHQLPVIVTAQRGDMLEASVACAACIDGETMDVLREQWRCFRVSDAGMNYDQARQVNPPNSIAKIHEAAVMREHCWVHADEVPAARRLRDGALRCLACRVPFDAQTTNLLVAFATPLERLKQQVSARDAAAAERVLQELDPAMFDERPEDLWGLLALAVTAYSIPVMRLICRRFPRALQWEGYPEALHNYSIDARASAALLQDLLECGARCTYDAHQHSNLVNNMIRWQYRDPPLLLGKLRVVFEHHDALGLSFAHVENCVDLYAEKSRGFSDDDFLAGFNLLLQYAQLVRDDHTWRGPHRSIVHAAMICDAAKWNDRRLMAYLHKTHALNLREMSQGNVNAYSLTSSPAVVEYLWRGGVDPQLISTEGYTALTALLRRVLHSTHPVSARDVQWCVQFYFARGVQVAPQHGTDVERTRQICNGFHTKDTALALQAYYEHPLRLAERVVEKWDTHREMLRLVQHVHMHKRLPEPRAGPRKVAALLAQHLVGAPRALGRLPALDGPERAEWSKHFDADAK